ncbi:hypothetical protein KKE06_01195 [Candidatus Micrarchaeota archaeon]|nr:hypothetical protein [Candidatus Micrarchaeota archaeon]MBU1930052.1 hypothetical protein [Candidatus Micrarchaeota archaeon]
MRSLKELLKEKRSQGEWNAMYMLIVLIIAALLLITVIKPMFKQSQRQIRDVKEAVE